MASKTRWIVTTSGTRPLSDLTKNLSETGFDVDQVLDEIGCITGTASDDVANTLRGIPGVADVSPETPIDIGPPDVPETW